MPSMVPDMYRLLTFESLHTLYLGKSEMTEKTIRLYQSSDVISGTRQKMLNKHKPLI